METTTPNHHPAHGRSLAGLFADLWRETSTLFRAETELAKAELSQKVSQIETALISLAIGVTVLVAALVLLLEAAVNALALVLPAEHAAWLSPLIVGGVVALIGLTALAKGRNELRSESIKPERTMRSLQQDIKLGTEHLR